MPLDAESAELLRCVRSLADRPLEQAEAMPPEMYISEEIARLEQKRIFETDWICVGLANEIPETGDYLTHVVAEQPIYVIRDSDGAVRCFANVCRHRMMRLLEGRGRAKRIVCPYHAWTYAMNGNLVGAPQMDRSARFDKKQVALPEFRAEIWDGWIYVTVNHEAAPIADMLKPLGKLTARYGAPNYVPVLHEDHVWRTNWKLLTENFMEGYHLPVAHKATVGAWFPEEETGFPDKSYAAFTYQSFVKEETARYGCAHASNKRLRGKWRYTSLLPTVFPSHMYVLAPDHLWYLSLRPLGVGETAVRFGAALAPEVYAALDDKEAEIAALSEFFTQVNAEDQFVVEGIYEGARAPHTQPGALSWLERELHDFMKYLSRRLTPAPPPDSETGAS